MNPIDTPPLMDAGAKASVSPDRLPELLDEAQAYFADRAEEYERRYETALETPDRRALFVEQGHWSAVGDALGFDERETDAVRRAHAAQLLYDGRSVGRRTEFEAALELRAAVVVARE